MESAPEKFNNLLNGAWRYKFCFCMPIRGVYRSGLLKLLDKFIHSLFVDILDNQVSNQRIDIIVDECRIAGID